MTTSSAVSARWNPWPVSIIAFFGVAILGCVAFVTFCARHPADLISSDYYEQEVRYQGQIDRLRQTQQQASLATVRYDAATRQIAISLPREGSPATPVGRVHLYRPSAASLDRHVALELNASRMQLIDASSLLPGLWKVRVSWTVDNREYFIDQAVAIPARNS